MTTKDQKMGELAVGAGAHGVTFSPDGQVAYITNRGAGSLSVVNVASHTLIQTVQVGTKPNGVVYRAR